MNVAKFDSRDYANPHTEEMIEEYNEIDAKMKRIERLEWVKSVMNDYAQGKISREEREERLSYKA